MARIRYADCYFSCRTDMSASRRRADGARRGVSDMTQRLIRPLGALSLVALLATACGTLGGAAVGAGSGAAIGAGVDSQDRSRGAATGALIGTGVGAAAGAVYDIIKHY